MLLSVECTNVEPVFPCYVIEGLVTVFSETKLNEAGIQNVQDAIRQSIENGNLENSDNRFLDVTWGAFETDETPDNGTGNGGGDNSGGGDTGGGGGDEPTTDDQGGSGNGGQGGDDSDPNGIEIDRADTSGAGMQPWAWALVGIGGVIFLSMIYFCLRRPRKRSNIESDSSDSGSSSSASSSKKSQSKRGGEVYQDEYVPAAEEDAEEESHHEEEIIEEEVSESEVSYEDLNVPVSGAVSEQYSASSSGRRDDESLDVPGPLLSKAPPSGGIDQSHLSLDLVHNMEDASALTGMEYTSSSFDPVPGQEDTSDSAYSSYEEVVEEEYEIEYEEDDHHDDDGEHHWEDDDVVNQTESQPILAHMAHSAQEGNTSAFNSMRKKWEVS